MARAQARNAEAIVKQREAQLAQARIDLERTQIRSPVDGIVIKRSIEVGQTVAASLQAPELFVIARNLADMQVEAAIDEADISRIRPRPAGRASRSTPFPAAPSTARSSRCARRRRRRRTSSPTWSWSRFANPGASLLPGMTANVRVVTDTRDDVLKVPNAALRVRIAGVEPRLRRAPQVADASAAAGRVAQPAQRAGGDGAGGPPAKLRDGSVARAVAEHTAQVDKHRRHPRRAARRASRSCATLPDEERAQGRANASSPTCARTIGEQLTPEQQPRYQAMLAELGGRARPRAVASTCSATTAQPRALNVRLGITDGTMTELLVRAELARAGAAEGGRG